MKGKVFTFGNLRLAVMVMLFAALIFGTVKYTGTGTLCAYCPAGILQVASASLSVTLFMLVCLICAAIIALLFGRAFCSWGCPTSFLRRVFGVKHRVSVSPGEAGKPAGLKPYYAYMVLAASAAGSFFAGFPVFCLFCPIDLFFGFIFAVHRLFVSYQPGWELLIFPAVIAAEIFLFRKWCAYICPIGAFFKLAGKIAAPFVRIGADKASCAVLNGRSCHICAASCGEGISAPHRPASAASDCTLCLNCKDKCPNGAVRAGFKAGKR